MGNTTTTARGWRRKHRLDLLIFGVLGSMGVAYGVALTRIPGLFSLALLTTPHTGLTETLPVRAPRPLPTGRDRGPVLVPRRAPARVVEEPPEPPMIALYRERIEEQITRRELRLNQLDSISPGSESFRNQINTERARLRVESEELHGMRDQLGRVNVTTLRDRLEAIERTEPTTVTVAPRSPPASRSALNVRSLNSFQLSRIEKQIDKRRRRIQQLQKLSPGSEAFKQQIATEVAARRAELEQLILLRENGAAQAGFRARLQQLETLGENIPDPRPSPPALLNPRR